ncbi:GHKL domain-containing protein [Marixanthomonas ophiurae]|uniref:histidine kinase n=2 Tax=Marixanthomonas ophiurae TaxID=387659 RepID=A0A3E1QED1_9FLAO|nr:GHKL domain-containing protein [Marixanthomonas ophiurae]
MRAVALTIQKSNDLIKVAESLYNELRLLDFTNIRNAQVVINLGDNQNYLVCIYTEGTAEIFKESRYETSPIIQNLYDELDTSHNALYQKEIKDKEFEDWLTWRKNTTSTFDKKLLEARSVCFYLYSIGEGHLGISTYNSITKQQLEILKRFRNVFELAYRRFMDVAKAEEQAENLKLEKETLEKTLIELKATQSQLIHSEKMASLGELTAGIAHEIQNPLNFVNNFSEISMELLEEMLEELNSGNIEEVKFITKDVIQNLEKTLYHGKRADGIVKGMLQHSRKNTDEKKYADINALADEYLRLAYHGLRAKDKSFNATLETDFDESIGKVYLIPQDMGRVILNLLNNAFYAVNDKKQQNLKYYQPTVSISTKKNKEKIEIKISDNGNGIPQNILDKIFQPFFTTKPTGEGTGLGLSLSYDIVKAQSGELKVQTKKEKGTTFIIELPLHQKKDQNQKSDTPK